MPKCDPDQPPPGACLLGEALRRYAGPELAAGLDAAEAAYAAAAAARSVPPMIVLGAMMPDPAEQRTIAAQAALVAAVQRLIDHGLAQLRAGEWIAWGREGSPAAPLRRLPAEAWALLRVPGDWWVALCNGEDTLAGGVVEVRGSPLVYYGVIVCAAAAQPRMPSIAAVRAAFVQAEAEKGKPLTVREVDAIAREMGARRALARNLLNELRRRGG